MKNNFAYLLFLLLVTVSCNRDKLYIENLRCEYLQDPLSIESQEPLLSWQLKSKQNGKKQTAYRILVASEPSLLKEMKADYWDSGIVPSSRSVQVTYKGKPLSSRQRVYWKVKVWDENNREIPWSKTATWTMGLLDPSDWKARWIASMEDTLPDSTLTWPAPYFRKEFAAKRPIKQAKAYVCGLGFYEMYLNGAKVGDQVLTPAVTNYDKREIQNILYFYDDQSTQRVLYNTFDVTSLLQKGDNTVGVILGNGWYNQRDRTIEGCMWYDTPRLLLQLEIEYDDGSRETIQTDPSWKCTTGPILHDAIFTGEIYDARMELGEWNRNGYDDSEWEQVLPVRAPTGVLRSQLAPFDKVTRTLTPDFNGKKNDSTYRFTLPEVISGWAGITVKGKAGDKVKLRFIGEEDVDFGQFDTYILKGEGTERWEPRFTWHAFRFIEVITKDVEMNAQSLVVKVVNTDPAKAGTFECSNEIFNAVNKAYILTQEGNFHGSVSSDCPHRERLAYTGDGQVIVESSILSFDMTQFYRKWFDDMDDARNKKTGYVPHTAPFGGGGGGPAWGSAYLIMPWAYFCYYGDTLLLKQHYHGMKQWVEYLKTRTDENGIVVREEPNGWCLGDWCTPDKVQIPEPLVNTAYYYHSTDLIAKIAAVLSEKEDHVYFTRLAAQIKSDFNRRFFNPETNHYWEGRQGADVFPLAFGMVPEENKEAVFNALLGHLKAIGDHFDTGILGTPLLLKVLTENGRMDIAYRIMNQQDAPGYSYLLDDKYSCLWERWNGRASRNHPMFGSVVAWFYNSLAGIRFDEENPGMKHMIIAPHPVDDLTFCKASYQSLYGTVRSEWEQTPDKFELTVEIPANNTATIHMPDKFKGDTEIIEVSSGTYRFSVKKAY
ncbi:MAG: glycoside hydrolase family 78 protein [Bacteroidales bacterium]|nr:glycoside hydrolase family 78 protein [Bacteroidales bacterium]